MNSFAAQPTNLAVLMLTGALSSCIIPAATCVAQSPTEQSSTAAACSKLLSLSIPNTTITIAAEYPAGPSPVANGQNAIRAGAGRGGNGPGGPGGPGAAGAGQNTANGGGVNGPGGPPPAGGQNNPPNGGGGGRGGLTAPICRVAGSIKPTPVSDIRFEVWMPVSGWNGKYEGVGNGGVAGSISYGPVMQAVNKGYASGSTDTGHQGSGLDGSWEFDNPQLVEDFVHNSQHLTAQAAKAIVKAYYSKPPEHSYFVGCSNGGGQGMNEVQRYPDDYDGIVDGDAASYLTHEWPGELYPAWLAQSDAKGFISKLPALHAAVVSKCDKIDGVEDGLLQDPRKCDFDPATIQCAAGTDTASCLTPPQVEWVKKIYRGVQDPTTGKTFWPGSAYGSELTWSTHISPASAVLPPASYMRAFVFHDRDWVYTDPNFSFDNAAGLKALNAASAKIGPTLDAINPDLSPFEKKGGKIIFYHGWSDADISPMNIVNYYQQLVSNVGGSKNEAAALHKTEEFARLFMVPGMAHCGGGEGPNSFDALGALNDWVEHGKAPDQIIASRMTNGKATRTRPLCPFPQVAKYKGSGSIDEAENFACVAP